ncbi:MAG: Fis family transcriptional regulator, partial [Candidatus Thiodiazotropha sp. (ex Dulcina madagascariensis)]|nr:Fis family transcriptional regulator [Candidatus Thiodiazotropha sp. (ex Dulcina madagascariensis)]
MQRYFKNLDGHGANNLYRLVMNEVEAPLLESVMKHTGGNQTQAAT